MAASKHRVRNAEHEVVVDPSAIKIDRDYEYCWEVAKATRYSVISSNVQTPALSLVSVRVGDCEQLISPLNAMVFYHLLLSFDIATAAPATSLSIVLRRHEIDLGPLLPLEHGWCAKRMRGHGTVKRRLDDPLGKIRILFEGVEVVP